MSNDFDPNCPHGHVFSKRPARVICTNAQGRYPIVALIEVPNGGDETAHFFSLDGSPSFLSEERLVNAPAPKRKFVRWVNMYASVGGHDSKRDADGLALSGRIACVRVEFEEGDGL